MSDSPFGRQPQPVKVTLEGEPLDVNYWAAHLMQRAEFKGDTCIGICEDGVAKYFTIYPRAVND